MILWSRDKFDDISHHSLLACINHYFGRDLLFLAMAMNMNVETTAQCQKTFTMSSECIISAQGVTRPARRQIILPYTALCKKNKISSGLVTFKGYKPRLTSDIHVLNQSLMCLPNIKIDFYDFIHLFSIH